MNDPDLLLRSIESQSLKAVFCDLFDTLILRTVHPEHVKKLASKRLCTELHLISHPESVYQLRAQIERDLCRQNEINGYDPDFNFDVFAEKIYGELKEREPQTLAGLGLAEFIETACAVETQVETAVERVDTSIAAVLKDFDERGIPVYGVSDFYLPRRMILELLTHHHLESLFRDVFVSSESLLTKRSGRLYDLVLQSVGVEPQSVLMIGDSEVPDHLMAGKKGIATHIVNRAEQRMFYREHFSDYETVSGVTKRLAEVERAKASWCSQRGSDDVYFEELALTLWSFVGKVHRLLTRRHARDVYFLSREGWFLRKLFDIYQGFGDLGGDTVRSHYLQVSRRSTMLPSLGSIDDEQFPALFPQYRRISPADFLLSLNFDAHEIADLCVAVDVDANTPVDDLPKSDTFQRLREDESFQALYETKRVEQRCNFRAYLRGLGIDKNDGELHLVDVGWKGTIQDNIFRALDGRKNIHGYYVGLITTKHPRPENSKTGVLFSRLPTMTKYYRVFNENRALFEIVLGADHPSVDAYRIIQGSAEAVYGQDQGETEWFHRVIEPIQMRIETRFRTICDVMSQSHFLPDDFDDLVAKNHARLVFFPTRQELGFFKSLHHKENFGVFGVTRFASEAEMTYSKRIRNLWKVVSNPRDVLQSAWWKPLALLDMGLGFLAPVYGGFRYVQAFIRG